MEMRQIAIEVVNGILANPDQTLMEDNYIVHQSLTEDRKYLIRIFVNERKRVVTVYKTSKIKKYYEGKI